MKKEDVKEIRECIVVNKGIDCDAVKKMNTNTLRGLDWCAKEFTISEGNLSDIFAQENEQFVQELGVVHKNGQNIFKEIKEKGWSLISLTIKGTVRENKRFTFLKNEILLDNHSRYKDMVNNRGYKKDTDGIDELLKDIDDFKSFLREEREKLWYSVEEDEFISTSAIENVKFIILIEQEVEE